MDLYIDLEKAINRAKLIQKRTMVRGQNGKIYYRMQWVDPRTGEPVSKEHAQQQQPVEEHKHAQQEPEFDNQKDFIDHHVKKMPREEKYNRINKYGLSWKRNDHPNIDHKNAVEALKNHLYNNPHLIGAEHLPKDKDPNKQKDGMDAIVDFTNSFKKRPEDLYKMMKELGIADEDPRLNPEWKPKDEGGNGMGAIRHMKNMMALKRHFEENPDDFNRMRSHPDYGNATAKPQPQPAPTQAKPKPQPNPQPKPEPKPSKAQQGGNTIKGILDNMSSEDKYALCKRLGIADHDPRQDPNIKDAMKPIHHMKFMMELKKRIEADPSILNQDPTTGGISKEEQERLDSLKGRAKTEEEVKNFLDRASKNLKLQWADDFSDHDLMKNRKVTGHDNVDNMHKLDALKKILVDDPSLMDELRPELENEELDNIKIGNKMMGRILREVAGLKGIGDVTMGYDKGREWEFGDESTAMIQEDDDGEPILSIFHVDKEGKEHDIAVPMKKIKEFLDKVKNGESPTDIKPTELPLHKKPLKAIWDALEDNFDANYTKEVGDVLKKSVGDLWTKAGKVSAVSAIAAASLDLYPFAVTKDTLKKLLEKYGVPIESKILTRADINSDAFKKVVYGHLVQKTKKGNAMGLLQQDASGRNDTWVLHESAKQWTPEERTEARKEFIKGNITIDEPEKYTEAYNYHKGEYGHLDDRTEKITNHLHKSLELYPFDIMTDVFARGCKLHFKKYNGDGTPHIGNYHSTAGGGHIVFDHSYIDDMESLDEEHPLWHQPKSRERVGKDGTKHGSYGTHPFSDTAAHEFAHAVDNYLSGAGNHAYLRWDTPNGRKYAGKNINVVGKSYDEAVGKSNPMHRVSLMPGKRGYLFHLDQWMSHYEGRIYDAKYYHKDINGKPSKSLGKAPDGSMIDADWGAGGERGLEHWSENVSRTMNAYHAYKEWKDLEGDYNTDFETWAGRMHDEFTAEGYGDEHNSKDGNPNSNAKYLTSYRSYKVPEDQRPINTRRLETYGYLYHTMLQRHPTLAKGIRQILIRPDFLGDKSVADPISRAEKDDYVRKSEVGLYIDLGE